MPFSQLLQVRKVLTNTQIKSGLIAGTVEIIPAPGPNKVIDFLKATVIVDCRAGVYENIGELAVLDFYVSDQVSQMAKNGSPGQVYQVDALLGDDSDVVYAQFGLKSLAHVALEAEDPPTYGNGNISVGGVRSLTDAINQPLLLILSNGGAVGDLTGGHEDNSMIVIPDYTIIDV